MLHLLVLIAVSILFQMREAAGTGTFYYFAYGSNLLSKRILIKNPSAVFYGPAKLLGYRLDFNMQVPMWNGAVATIVSDPTSTVWGSLWLINSDKMKNLDTQEGVDRGWYFAKNVSVRKEDGRKIVARTYIETHNPSKLKPGRHLPYGRRPSKTYLKVIIIGAIESGLPAYYVQYLKTFPTNHRKATPETLKALGPGIIINNIFYSFDQDL